MLSPDPELLALMDPGSRPLGSWTARRLDLEEDQEMGAIKLERKEEMGGAKKPLKAKARDRLTRPIPPLVKRRQQIFVNILLDSLI